MRLLFRRCSLAARVLRLVDRADDGLHAMSSDDGAFALANVDVITAFMLVEEFAGLGERRRVVVELKGFK